MPPRIKKSKKSKSSKKSPLGLLGRLPIELRQEIYGHVFPHADGVIVEFDIFCNLESGRINVYRAQNDRQDQRAQPLLDDYRALSLASKSICVDIAPVFWKAIIFEFRVQGMSRVSVIQRLGIAFSIPTPKNSIFAHVDKICALRMSLEFRDAQDSEALKEARERDPDNAPRLFCHQQFDIELRKRDDDRTNIIVTASQWCNGDWPLEDVTDDLRARDYWINDYLTAAFNEPGQNDLNITIASVLFLKLTSMDLREFKYGSKALENTHREWMGMMADKTGRAAQARSWWVPGGECIFGGWVPLAYDAELNLEPEEGMEGNEGKADADMVDA